MKNLLTVGNDSDESRQRKLYVLLQAGEPHADQSEGAGSVAERAVEERAGKLADPAGIVGSDHE